MQKKLYRDPNNKVIAGVCSGLAEYINIDTTVIRVIFALVAIFGAGLLVYLVCALIIPEKPTNYINE